METKGFDFDAWFMRRLSPHTPNGEPRRPGTFTVSRGDLLTDLTYDYQQACGGKGKKAKALCKQALRESNSLAYDEIGYFLKGEPRIQHDSEKTPDVQPSTRPRPDWHSDPDYEEHAIRERLKRQQAEQVAISQGEHELYDDTESGENLAAA